MNAQPLHPPLPASEPAPRAANAEGWHLLRQASQGHEASARQLVRQLSPMAHGLAMQLLRHAPDAEDAVQDAFARLWASQATDGHGATLATYFNTIVINRCKTRLVQRRELATDPELLAPMADERQLGQTPDATAWADAGEPMSGSRQAVAQALERLPPRQRMALAMWAYADADVPDIARSLDLTTNAAHQLLHRARQTLKLLLTRGQP